MNMLARLVVASALSLFAVGLVLASVLFVVRPRGVDLRAAMRLVPDTIGLLRRIATDTTLPVRVRARVWLLLAYLLFPIDLVPDFLPVIGYADDVVVVVIALRGVVRVAGSDVIERHWPGTPDGLAELLRLLGRRDEQR